MPTRRRSELDFGEPRRPRPITPGGEAWSRLVPDEHALSHRFSQPVVRTTSLLTGVFATPLPRTQPWWLYAGSAALAIALGGTLSSSFVLGNPWFGNERTASGRRSSRTGAETPLLRAPDSITPVANEHQTGVDRSADGSHLHNDAPVSTSRGKRRGKPRSLSAGAPNDQSTLQAPSNSAEVDPLREPDMDLMDIPSSPMEEQALEAARARQGASAGNATAAREEGYGTLRINSRPWAQVYVDGSPMGYTPVSALQVAAGRHSVQLVNANLRMSKTFVVHVTQGETLTRVEALDEQPSEQPSEPAPAAVRAAPRPPEMSLL